MVIPARTSYLNLPKLYFGNHSNIGTKYCNAFPGRRSGGSFRNCRKGSSGKKVSLRLDLNLVAKLLGLEKLTGWVEEGAMLILSLTRIF